MFSLDRYFQRIGYAGPRVPTLDVLHAVCTHHVDHIVYENIGPLLGEVPVLALPALQDKLLDQGRGGYCYEQNLLLSEALQALGMSVTPLAARVAWMRPPGEPLRPRTHMLLKVELPGDPSGACIADVGFGGHLLDQPLRLEIGVAQRTAHATLRVTRDGDMHTLESQLPQGFMPMYRYTLEPHQPADYEPLNWYTATHPGSIFCHNLLMERLSPTQRMSLLNDRLIVRRPALPPVVRRLATQAEFDTVLAEQFRLSLPPATRAALFARIPKGLDQFSVPATP